MMRPLLLALLLAAPAAAQVGPPSPAAPAGRPEGYDPSLDSMRYDGCVRAIEADPRKVADFALQWQALGGGLPARHCQALAQLAMGEHRAAAETLARAARAAEAAKSPMAADFWGQAGNALLLAGDSGGAVAHFSSGLVAAGEFAPVRSANLLIDRARARTETGDLAGARADLDRATALAPAEPAGWLLSAALARRQNDLPRAAADIARAAALTPSDPDVRFEQGAVLAAQGDLAGARTLWDGLVRAAPQSDAAALARKALAATPPPAP